nr:excinuclease ABC subunit A [Micromonospora sp. DSM 115978]
GRPHCPKCGRPISRQTPQQIVDRLLELPEGTRFQVLAPIVRGRKGEYVDLFSELQLKGFARARVDGVVVPLTDVPKLDKQKKHTIEVVVDRLAAKPSSKQRLTDSIETALGLGSGLVLLDFVDRDQADPERERMYSEHLACLYDDLSFEELEPRSFSFNSPYGACPECSGLGTRKEVDPELLVPDPTLSLNDGAVQPWAGGHNKEYFTRLLAALAEDLSFKMTTPWEGLPERARQAVLFGSGDAEIHVGYT